MNRLPHFEQTYKVFTPILTTRYTQSEIVSGLDYYNSVITYSNSGSIDVTGANANFSFQVNDSSYYGYMSSCILSLIYLNTSSIIQSSENISSDDSNGYKCTAYSIRTSNEQLAHYIIGSTKL